MKNRTSIHQNFINIGKTHRKSNYRQSNEIRIFHVIISHNYRMEYQYIDTNLTSAEQNLQISAMQQNVTPESIVSVVLQNENVVGARCFEVQNTYIIAVLTVPIYLKSERDKCKTDIQNTISQMCSKEVIVTFDVDIYAKIKPNMSDTDKTSLYKKVTARL